MSIEVEEIALRYKNAKTILEEPQLNDAVFPHWVSGGRFFWYIRQTRKGRNYRWVDPEKMSNDPLFDHQDLASKLQEKVGEEVDFDNLPIDIVDVDMEFRKIIFQSFKKQWALSLGGAVLSEMGPIENNQEPSAESMLKGHKPNELISPDGEKVVFLRNRNIWLRDAKTGHEKALTKDGTESSEYGVAGIQDGYNVQAVWSPKSTHIFTVLLDVRRVGERPLVFFSPRDGNLKPRIDGIKNPYPGDENIGVYHLKVLDLDGGVQAVNSGSLPITSSYARFFSEKRGWWSSDGRRVLFVDEARGGQKVRLLSFDIDSGETQILLEEYSETFVKLMHTVEDIPVFIPLLETDELIWFSERNGWGHLYLYDTKTGKEKSVLTGLDPIKEGIEWNVRNILHFDSVSRELLIQTSGRDKKINPYYCDICRLNIDSGELTSVSTGNFEHSIFRPRSALAVAIIARNAWGIDRGETDGISPDGRYIVATRSRADMAPVSILLDREGEVILQLETADLSCMPEGWQWPEPIITKAADAKTDIHTVIFRPVGFSSKKRYPVIDLASNLRDLASMPVGSFINSPVYGFGYQLSLAMAALGFVVVAIGGRGGPYRGKAFQDHKFGDPAGTDDPDDHVAVLRHLAKSNSYMDIDRVGIAGIDAQCASVYRFFKRQDFYKVAVFTAYTDLRFSAASSSERCYGVSVFSNKSTRGFIEDYAKDLKGNLLLICGGLEYGTPASTLRLVDALQRANKSFDMLLLPNLFTNPTGYTLRREWDYLLMHLQGTQLPIDAALRLRDDEIAERHLQA